MDGVATRRRVIVSAPGLVEVCTEAVASAHPGEAVVRLRAAGVCGTDKAAAFGENAFLKPPYYPGHEVVGEVVRIADDGSRISVGDRVTVEPTLICGHCKPCITGRDNLCENQEFFGCGYREGGMADLFTVPAACLYPVPAGFSDSDAVLIEPLATPIHAVRLAGDLTGKAVAILGAGTIGLLVLAAARWRGARRIVMTDRLPIKRDLALQLGADEAIDAARPDVATAIRSELGESADVVFDCVGVESTVATAINAALRGGTVVVLGCAPRPITIDLPVVQEYQVRIQGTTTYRVEDFDDAIDLIRTGGVDAQKIITSTYPLSRAVEGFQATLSGQEVKVVIVPD